MKGKEKTLKMEVLSLIYSFRPSYLFVQIALDYFFFTTANYLLRVSSFSICFRSFHFPQNYTESKDSELSLITDLLLPDLSHSLSRFQKPKDKFTLPFFLSHYDILLKGLHLIYWTL